MGIEDPQAVKQKIEALKIEVAGLREELGRARKDLRELTEMIDEELLGDDPSRPIENIFEAGTGI